MKLRGGQRQVMKSLWVLKSLHTWRIIESHGQKKVMILAVFENTTLRTGQKTAQKGAVQEREATSLDQSGLDRRK